MEHFEVASLDGFGCGDLGVGLCSAGALLQYLGETHHASLAHIRRLSKYTADEHLLLDRSTRLSLELTQTIRERDRRGSLLWVLDRTVTPMGARMLKQWLLYPLRDVNRIRERHDGVGFFYERHQLREEIRALLRQVYDVERLAARISCGRAGPRDLLSLKQSLAAVPRLRAKFSKADQPSVEKLSETLDPVEEAKVAIGAAIVADPPLNVRDGGIFRHGYNPELDELHSIQRDGRSWIANFQAQESRRTGISTLKVGYNRIFGYYIEVTNTHAEKVPPDYVRKQTLKNAERYITPQLKEYETRVLTADEKAKELEYKLFLELRDEVARHTERLQQTAFAIAELDVLTSLAEVAVHNRYTRPEVTEDLVLKLTESRHPVLEQTLTDEEFVPNDLEMDGKKENIFVITGPNMAGKSTYIRQVALILLMAQMGSFVPAKKATVGVVDRIFTRIGAADEIARGQSTFMVEMVETANIVNNATARSLIILDEVGRGTSTFDGVSIAWAVAEFIHEHLHSRTLFATHYHELTELAQLYPDIRNYNVAVREWEDEVVFLRKIIEGGTDKSYGLHVARLAGIPKEVVERAKVVLSNLESQLVDEDNRPRFAGPKGKVLPASGGAPPAKPMQLTLFTPEGEKIAKALRQIDLQKMTPIEALNKLEELKRIAGQ